MTTTAVTRTVWQGESFTYTFTVRDSVDQLIDLTGAALKWILWHPLKGTAVNKSTASPPGGITILNQTTDKGKCTVTVAEADLKTLAPLTYWHGLFYDPLAGNADVIEQGYIILESSRGMAT